jgi:hypothetical protein
MAWQGIEARFSGGSQTFLLEQLICEKQKTLAEPENKGFDTLPGHFLTKTCIYCISH